MTDGTLRLRATDLEWRDSEGEVVILDLRSSAYMAANRSGSRLWQALADGTTAELLTVMLVDTYGISTDQAAADIEMFVAGLVAQGLILE